MTGDRTAMTEGYEVPKREVEAEVLLAGGDRGPVHLFLAERAEHHTGPERPSDLLNDSDDDFFAVRGPEGELALLNRSALLVLSVPASEETGPEQEIAPGEDHGDAPGNVTTRRIRVRMEDGTEITGTASYLRPPGERRIRDHLNRGEAFVPLRDGETVRFVNRARIARVTLRPTS